VPHDAHFLQRVERASHEHLEIAMGLYRDHELVKYVLDHVRVPEGSDRVALALADDGRGPHVVVAQNGHFVTCLGEGMSTGSLPIVTRARLDALAAKVTRVRDGLLLARKRGVDAAGILEKLESAGQAVSREDFLAASALVGPFATMLLRTYTSRAEALSVVFPSLTSSGLDVATRRRGEAAVARGAWSMAHLAMLIVGSAERDWVDDWAKAFSSAPSPWYWLSDLSALPFAVRAAWLGARLGKPVLPAYKRRFLEPLNAIEALEAGWGLVAMALRHQGLRSEIWRTLRTPREEDPANPPWLWNAVRPLAEVTQLLDEKEDALREESMKLARDLVVLQTAEFPETSRHKYKSAEDVPEDVARSSLLGLWLDSYNHDKGPTFMLHGVLLSASARPEDFYLPATYVHALGPQDLEEDGRSLAEMRRALYGVSKPAALPSKPGRNEPCSCGSGKKFKKCHGR
jgi:hypothetical protein